MVGVLSVVIRDKDCVILDSHITVQTQEEVSRQMRGIPLPKWLLQPGSQLVDDRLGNQRHAHLTVADVQVQRPGTFPAQGLIEVEEFFDVPAAGELRRQQLHLVTLERGEEGLVAAIVRAFTAARPSSPRSRVTRWSC